MPGPGMPGLRGKLEQRRIHARPVNLRSSTGHNVERVLRSRDHLQLEQWRLRATGTTQSEPVGVFAKQPGGPTQATGSPGLGPGLRALRSYGGSAMPQPHTPLGGTPYFLSFKEGELGVARLLVLRWSDLFCCVAKDSEARKAEGLRIVTPEFRRKGIARRLVAEIKSQLFAKGATRLSALVEHEHQWAIDFWDSVKDLGYERDPKFCKVHRGNDGRLKRRQNRSIGKMHDVISRPGPESCGNCLVG